MISMGRKLPLNRNILMIPRRIGHGESLIGTKALYLDWARRLELGLKMRL